MALYRQRIHAIAFVFIFLFLSVSKQVNAQAFKKSLNWVVYHSLVDTVSAGRPSFRIYPTLAYAPETSLEIGFSTLFLFQAKGDSTNRLSEINAFTFVTGSGGRVFFQYHDLNELLKQLTDAGFAEVKTFIVNFKTSETTADIHTIVVAQKN